MHRTMRRCMRGGLHGGHNHHGMGAPWGAHQLARTRTRTCMHACSKTDGRCASSTHIPSLFQTLIASCNASLACNLHSTYIVRLSLSAKPGQHAYCVFDIEAFTDQDKTITTWVLSKSSSKGYTSFLIIGLGGLTARTAFSRAVWCVPVW